MARSRDDVRDDYDDEDERPRRRRRAESDQGNTSVKVMAIIGAIVLGVLVVCGGLAAVVAYSVSQAVKGVSTSMQQLAKEVGRWQEAQDAAETFLREVRRNDYDRAYELTSKAYRERVTRKGLEEYVAKWPAIRSSNATLVPQNPGFGGKRITFKSLDAATGRPVNVSVVVVDEDGSWKIDDLEAD
jgi:outer membrane murein-binding lipoprotein Lpp